MSRKATHSDPAARAPRLSRGGVVLEGKTLPLLAGSVHYWRLDPDAWRPALEALRELGLHLVDTYVPWGVHEKNPREYDFGEIEARLDLARFLEIAAEIGLYAIVRPGPHINAELTHFGIPERIVWNAECQARSSGGQPVVLPVPPLAFPVPSYASRAFLNEACHWLAASGAKIAPLCYPRGPVVLVQVDNEGAMYFRDGVYDQDYHPDAVRGYRKFLKRKYESTEELSRALGREVDSFELEPPRAFDAETSRQLGVHLDWAEAQEHLLVKSFRRMKEALVEAGVEVPFSHNLPLGESMTPLDPGRVGEVVELVGLDYYHAASPEQRAEIARRTSELAVRSEARGAPAFACELGAGFPPFFPPLMEADNAFTALTALAYGLRGFNVYMAVERDRWIGAPYDRRARARPSAEFWSKLCRALESVRFHELERTAPVHLVVPRSLRRLHRVQHAFGPLSAVLFQIMGRGAMDAGLEDELDLGAPFALDAERFLRWFEQELDRRRVPFALVGGDLIEHSLATARWSIVACAGGLERDIVRAAGRAVKDGKNVSLGPHFPQRDETWVPREPPGALRHAFRGSVPVLLDFDPTRLAAILDAAVRELGLPTFEVEPSELSLTVHQDASAQPRVVFAINPVSYAVNASVASFGAERADDLLDGSSFHAKFGVFELPVPPRSVRMLALRS